MAPAMQSAELQFAQRLASSEKGVRDRAVRKLRQYLSARTQSDTGFSQDELLKIWRGLFYCMWVQDEPLLQEELANIISQLIHVVHSSEAQHLFLQTFWQTMNREWEETTDELQLDKYCMLIRLVLRQSFEVLKRKAWEESQIKLFLDVLTKEILSPESQSSDGVRNHLIDAYLDELSIVGGREFDLKAVADRLLEVANSKSTPPFNRKRLFRLIRKFQNPSEGNSAQLSFAQDISADENGQALSQRKHKKKRKKLLERAALDKEKGNIVSLDGEEDNGGNIPKKKRKKKKKSHFQAETQDLGAVIMPPAESTDLEPNNAKRQTPQACVTGPAAEPTASIKENSSEPTPIFPTHKKRKRPRKKSLRAHRELWKSIPLSQEDVAENDPSNDRPQSSAAQVSSSEGVQRKRKRKLRAVPVNSGGLTVQKAGTPTSPSEEKDSQTTLPQCKRPQKKTVSCSLDLHDLSSQKSAILKKRKKMKLMSKLVEHNGVTESSAGQIPALLRGECPERGAGLDQESNRNLKKPLKMEDDFVKFDTHFLPKPLFFRKAKSSSAIRPQSPAVQLNKTPSSSKKVTFGLNRNMTAEFKKTDKSILVSPTGLSRVAFNPEQRPLHGVLKTPTSSPASTPMSTMKLPATTPKRRPRAADFF
ncbi:ribosomal RNA processing protein 1 homolog B isoform X2 [Alexandromys fortis]|uniref:ribosomal RNA processing protein 1 homolog B isoform X2 n=1 Tax=Alexandromys fortis TaxID=100897 RepID=UPI002152B156|nr:ribosomal RNA processing protein 1 homolog B isoform X2 [Microtus fortis]